MWSHYDVMLEIKDGMFVSRLPHDNSVKINGKMYNKTKNTTLLEQFKN